MLKKAKKLVFKYRIYILGIFCLGLILDIFFNPRISDFIVLSLAILWIINVVTFKLKPIQTLILAAASYGISFIFQFLNKEMIMEKGASWFFVFLSLAVGQRIVKEFSKR
jgi:hypothetical protein